MYICVYVHAGSWRNWGPHIESWTSQGCPPCNSSALPQITHQPRLAWYGPSPLPCAPHNCQAHPLAIRSQCARWTLNIIVSGILRLWQKGILTLQCQGAKLLGIIGKKCNLMKLGKKRSKMVTNSNPGRFCIQLLFRPKNKKLAAFICHFAMWLPQRIVNKTVSGCPNRFSKFNHREEKNAKKCASINNAKLDWDSFSYLLRKRGPWPVNGLFEPQQSSCHGVASKPTSTACVTMGCFTFWGKPLIIFFHCLGLRPNQFPSFGPGHVVILDLTTMPDQRHWA